VHGGNDCAVREGKLPFAYALIATSLPKSQRNCGGCLLREATEITSSRGIRGGLLVTKTAAALYRLSRYKGHVADNSRHRCNCNQQESDALPRGASFEDANFSFFLASSLPNIGRTILELDAIGFGNA